MALSGIQLSAGIVVGSNTAVDAKYGPYADLATAKSEIGVSLRYLGLTVGIETSGTVEEYWWESGTADGDLVAKGGGGGGGTWGSITGTLSDQTDLQSALDGKEATITATTSADYYRGDKTFATLDKAAVGLSNVDNTSDANKPISSATQTALNAKEPTITATTSADYYRGDKTFATLDKTAVGLSNVDNTSDANKPISTATQTALDGKVDENASITGATKTKITYDSKGLVTAGEDITASDLPSGIDAAKIADGSVSNAEFQYLGSVTSDIQTQLNGKQATITGAATTIDDTDLTVSRALVSDGSGKVAVSDVTSTELGYLDGVTSAVQTQLDNKIAKSTGTTYNVYTLSAVSQAEYNALTPDADTIYFII